MIFDEELESEIQILQNQLKIFIKFGKCLLKAVNGLCSYFPADILLRKLLCAKKQPTE